MENGESVSIVYGGGSKGPGRRQITPHTLIEERGNLYLIDRQVKEHLGPSRVNRCLPRRRNGNTGNNLLVATVSECSAVCVEFG